MTTIARQLVRSAPLRVVVDLNEACNLRCKYCHVDAISLSERKISRELPLDAFRRIVKEAEQMRVFDLTLTGGEITIMQSLPHYLKELTALKYVAAQIITNGTTLTPKTIQQYLDSGLARLSISLDGFAATNDSQRGLGTFEKALRGIQTAVAAGVRVNVISVLSRQNYLEWPTFSRFIREEGVTSHNLTLLCRLGRAEAMSDWAGLDESQIRVVRSEFADVSPELRTGTFALSLNAGALEPGEWDGRPTPVHQLQDVMPCTEAVVKLNGDVHTNRVIGKTGAIGNIHRNTLAEVWQASEDSRLRTAMRVIENPDTNARSYYGLSALHATSSGGVGTERHSVVGPHRSRLLGDGRLLSFRWHDFCAEMAAPV